MTVADMNGWVQLRRGGHKDRYTIEENAHWRWRIHVTEEGKS